MKRLIILFLLVSLTKLNAQINEIGVFVGGSNYIGDVGAANYIKPNELAFGILYKWNKSPRHAYRISYTQTLITGNDAQASDKSRLKRGYSFENEIKDITAGIEFNFFDFNLHEMEMKTTPYIFIGATYFRYNELYYKGKEAQYNESTNTFAIPMTVGIKSKITPTLVLGAEVGARYTLTDNLDGSNPKGTPYEKSKFGNINSNDWYVFSGFTLTYTFGEKPCYCPEK